MLAALLDAVEAFQNVARAIAKSYGAAVRTRHRVFALRECSDEPVHFCGFKSHVDFDRSAARDGGADVATDFVERGCAEFALGYFENFDYYCFNVGWLTPAGAALMAMVRWPKGSVSKP